MCVQANLRTTLIIATYNWPVALDLTIKSVARQSVRPDEIIVADDGSGPERNRSSMAGVRLLTGEQTERTGGNGAGPRRRRAGGTSLPAVEVA